MTVPFPSVESKVAARSYKGSMNGKKKKTLTLEVRVPWSGLNVQGDFYSKFWNANKVWFIATCNLGFVLVTLAIYHLSPNSHLFYIFFWVWKQNVIQCWCLDFAAWTWGLCWRLRLKAGSFDLLTHVFGSCCWLWADGFGSSAYQHLCVVSPHPATLGFFTAMMSSFQASSESESRAKLSQVYHPPSEIRQCSSATLSL